MLGSLTAEAASTIIANLPSQDMIGTIGEPFAPYYAQTFEALSPGEASTLTIELAHAEGPNAAKFRVLVTEVLGYGDNFHPTTVLFESPVQIIDVGSPVTQLSIPLLNLQLQPGSRYAFILDAFVTRDGSWGTARAGTNSTYPNGEFYFNQGFGGDTRSEHFADQWFFAEAIYPYRFHDLAFEMTFVPEPSAAVLTLLGTGAAMLRRRRLPNATPAEQGGGAKRESRRVGSLRSGGFNPAQTRHL